VLAGRLIAFGALVMGLMPAWPWAAWMAAPFWAICLLTCLATRRAFARHIRRLHRLTPDSRDGEEGPLPPVAIIAPARNEEEAIEGAARSLAAQDYPGTEIFVIDDHSTDDTGAILDRLARELPRLRVIHDPPLQEGWLGKANAVWHAVHQTGPNVTWLCLTDADIWFHPKTLRRAVAYAERMGFDFLTCVPRLDHGSWAEELVISRSWGGLIIESDMERFNTSLVQPIGVGAFILVKRAVYLASGGHAARPGEQPEDYLLAKTIKDQGARMGLAWTSEMIRLRLYRGWKQVLRVLVRKNRINTNDNPVKILGQALLPILGYLVPGPFALIMGIELALFGWRWGIGICCLLAAWTYFETVRLLALHRELCRMRRVTPWLTPLMGLLRAGIEMITLFHALLDRPMEWRGRVFVHASAAQKPGLEKQ